MVLIPLSLSKAYVTAGFYLSLIKVRFLKFLILCQCFLFSRFLVEILLVNSSLNGAKINQYFFFLEEATINLIYLTAFESIRELCGKENRSSRRHSVE